MILRLKKSRFNAKHRISELCLLTQNTREVYFAQLQGSYAVSKNHLRLVSSSIPFLFGLQRTYLLFFYTFSRKFYFQNSKSKSLTINLKANHYEQD
jgi:hypothetical protein